MAAFRYVGDGTKLKLEWAPRHEGVSPWIQGSYQWTLYDLGNLFSVPKLKEHSVTITPSDPRTTRPPITVRKTPSFRLRAVGSGYLDVARGERWPGSVTLEDLGLSRPAIGPRAPTTTGRTNTEHLEILPLRDMTRADRIKALEEDDARAVLLARPEAFDHAAMLIAQQWRNGSGPRFLSPRTVREDLQKYPPHVRRTEAWCCQGHADCKEFPELGRACFFQPGEARAARRRR